MLWTDVVVWCSGCRNVQGRTGYFWSDRAGTSGTLPNVQDRTASEFLQIVQRKLYKKISQEFQKNLTGQSSRKKLIIDISLCQIREQSALMQKSTIDHVRKTTSSTHFHKKESSATCLFHKKMFLQTIPVSIHRLLQAQIFFLDHRPDRRPQPNWKKNNNIFTRHNLVLLRRHREWS